MTCIPVAPCIQAAPQVRGSPAPNKHAPMNTRKFLTIALVLFACAVCSAQKIEGTYYFADQAFPQFMPLWFEGWSFKDESGQRLQYARPGMPLGGYAFVYWVNTGATPMTVRDLTLQGISLTRAIAKEEEFVKAEDKYRSSILISDLPKAQTGALMDAGWPAWWMPEPKVVAPGERGSIVLRLRRRSKPAQLKLGIVTDRGVIPATVAPARAQPRFATIAFSPDLKTCYVYPKHVRAGLRPSRVLLDGRDVTALCAISADPSLAVSSIVVKLARPLEIMSYHTFRVEYPDQTAAQAGIRAWGRDMIYGVWSSPEGGSSPETALKGFVDDYAEHNVNCIMPFVIGPARQYFDSDAGWDYCESRGVGRMTHWPDGRHVETILFALDEPDASDANFPKVDPDKRLGGLGRWLVDWVRILREHGPKSPILLNIDNTYKPENWYTYHQLPDIPCIDPYYTESQGYQDFYDPYNYQYHTRPTYVQGAATISQSSGQPKPLHVILFSCPYEGAAGRGRLPTPEEKRMEVYYAIGSGAKGLSYWMYPTCLDNGTEGARKLWQAIGLMGAEVRTAGPVTTVSCPVQLPARATKYLWVRALLSGTDTLVVVTVNENVACDRVGTIVRPAEDAKVTVRLPAWIAPRDAFEISPDGTRQVDWKVDSGNVSLSLGKVDISSFAVVTSNPGLRERLQKRYDEQFAVRVQRLKAGARDQRVPGSPPR